MMSRITPVQSNAWSATDLATEFEAWSTTWNAVRQNAPTYLKRRHTDYRSLSSHNEGYECDLEKVESKARASFDAFTK